MTLKNIIITSLLVLTASSFAQVDDNVLWASFGLNKTLNEKVSLKFAPIVRYNNDISDYQNMSIDYAVNYKFAKNWSAKLTGRTWFIPNGTNRQFIWPQITYGKKLGAFKLGSYLRYHYAIDIKDNVDPDFIRWDISLAYLNFGKFQASFAIEPWLRLNSFNEIQRIRYKPGVKYTFNDEINLSLILWNEQNTTLANGLDFNIWVLTLNYNL